MELGEWLRSLGLGQYEEKFRTNAIDADVLTDLTDGDLEKLGLPLGDRKRLLRAIAVLASPKSPTTEARLGGAANTPRRPAPASPISTI